MSMPGPTINDYEAALMAAQLELSDTQDRVNRVLAIVTSALELAERLRRDMEVMTDNRRIFENRLWQRLGSDEFMQVMAFACGWTDTEPE